MLSRRQVFLSLVSTLALLPVFLWGQNEIGPTDRYSGIGTQRLVAGRVLSPKGDPISGASVRIENNAGASLRTVRTNERGEFRAEYLFYQESESLKQFAVKLRVSKKGYIEGRRYEEIPTLENATAIPITLRPTQPEDPSLLSQAELFQNLAPRLRQLGPEDGLPAQEEKDYTRGVQELLDQNLPERAVPLLMKAARRSPSCLRCRTMLALAELNWGDWDGARRELGASVNALIEDRRLARPEPLVAFGVFISWDHLPEKASAYLSEALKYAPEDPLALQELGRVQCLNMNWEAGAESLKHALAVGASPEARVLLIEALIWAGTTTEANAELAKYLDGRDLKKMPPRVRSLAARIHDRENDEAALQYRTEAARAGGKHVFDYLNHPPEISPDFEPAPDQAPLPSILAELGKNIAKFYSDLPNLSAAEDVHQGKLGKHGREDFTRDRKYRYLCMIPSEQWGPTINEFRTDPGGHETPQGGLSQGFMMTAGFVAIPMVFHPSYQNGSLFRLLGRQKLNGRENFVVAYAQQPIRSRIFGVFQMGTTSRATHAQGIAWIDAEYCQIVRLVSNLLQPVPAVRLEKVTTEIDFTEVHLNSVTHSFWLPSQVTVSINWNGNSLRNQHAYSDFMVFKVDSSQKLGDLASAGRDDKPTKSVRSESPSPLAPAIPAN